jgi:hypothetical protein
VRVTSADRSEDILVCALGPKRIDRGEISHRKRGQPRKVPKHRSKRSLGVVSRRGRSATLR